MAEAPRVQLTPHAGKRTCPFCRGPFFESEKLWTCPRCSTVHHVECASENRKCALFGCGAEAPVVLPLSGGRIRVVPRPQAQSMCVVCRTDVDVNDDAVPLWSCPDCFELQHRDCITELRHCGACGALAPGVPVGRVLTAEDREEALQTQIVSVAIGALGLSLLAGAGWLFSVTERFEVHVLGSTRVYLKVEHPHVVAALVCLVAGLAAVYAGFRMLRGK
jgi:hypothetical protein